MAYSGKYKVQNPTKYQGDHTKVVYRSLWEKSVFMWCDANDNIAKWSSEEVIVPYLYEADRKYHRYFPDLKITYKSGKTILVEIKPNKETSPPTGDRRTKKYINEALTYVKNMNKWEAAEEYCKDRGWEFRVWTEVTLQEMGLMPKPIKKVPGKLKPLKPYRKKSRKKL